MSEQLHNPELHNLTQLVELSRQLLKGMQHHKEGPDFYRSITEPIVFHIWPADALLVEKEAGRRKLLRTVPTGGVPEFQLDIRSYDSEGPHFHIVESFSYSNSRGLFRHEMSSWQKEFLESQRLGPEDNLYPKRTKLTISDPTIRALTYLRNKHDPDFDYGPQAVNWLKNQEVDDNGRK